MTNVGSRSIKAYVAFYLLYSTDYFGKQRDLLALKSSDPDLLGQSVFKLAQRCSINIVDSLLL